MYADWLDDHGLPERAELLRACEGMRRVPNWSDGWWTLKAQRDALRPMCPAEWLEASGALRYDPLWRDGWPEGWRERWRFIRAFAEQWHGVLMPDVGGRQEEIRAEEERLGMTLPPSVREYVAFAYDAGTALPAGGRIIYRDPYALDRIAGQPALSLMTIAEGNLCWAVRDEDVVHDDPAIHEYVWPEGSFSRYVPYEPDGDEDADELAESVVSASRFVLGFVEDYSHDQAHYYATISDPASFRTTLDAILPVRSEVLWEGDGILVRTFPWSSGGTQQAKVKVHRGTPWDAVPLFLRELAPRRSGG
ncbi:MAG: hypothetical protein K2W96_13140 [Gemmataceae bacterium]|nr:hypothetical protein [Gemmataceae bacterium]